MEKLQIYFAGSIRGGRQKRADFKKIIELLKKHGDVLTEHVGGGTKQKAKGDTAIKEQDRKWIGEADIIIADISVLSEGVGYELGVAEERHKPIYLLQDLNVKRKKVSAMYDGFPIIKYREVGDLEEEFFKIIKQCVNCDKIILEPKSIFEQWYLTEHRIEDGEMVNVFSHFPRCPRLVPTKLGLIVHRWSADPVLALRMLDSLKVSGDMDMAIHNYSLLLYELMLSIIANDDNEQIYANSATYTVTKEEMKLLPYYKNLDSPDVDQDDLAPKDKVHESYNARQSEEIQAQIKQLMDLLERGKKQ